MGQAPLLHDARVLAPLRQLLAIEQLLTGYCYSYFIFTIRTIITLKILLVLCRI